MTLTTGFTRLCVLLAAGVLFGCSSVKDLALAQAQIPYFRQLVANQQFDRIYVEASDELKKATTQQNMVSFLAAVDRKLGAVKATQKNGWNVNFRTSGTFVTLGFKTQFERGEGEETFVYCIRDGKPVLAGYHINSNALVTN